MRSSKSNLLVTSSNDSFACLHFLPENTSEPENRFSVDRFQVEKTTLAPKPHGCPVKGFFRGRRKRERIWTHFQRTIGQSVQNLNVGVRELNRSSEKEMSKNVEGKTYSDCVCEREREKVVVKRNKSCTFKTSERSISLLVGVGVGNPQ